MGATKRKRKKTHKVDALALSVADKGQLSLGFAYLVAQVTQDPRLLVRCWLAEPGLLEFIELAKAGELPGA